jgi:hypothetical protein
VVGGVLGAFLIFAAAAIAAGAFHQVKPAVFDPAHSNLAQSGWLSGIGCPTSQDIQAFLPPDFSTTGTVNYKDTGCPTGDSQDRTNEGLLLAKTGPTNNNAAGTARLNDVPSTVTELGYDIRKGGAPASAIGSHCGAGAPRFDIVTRSGAIYFIGCNSPPPTVAAASTGWTRLRWGGSTLAFGQGTTPPAALSSLNVKEIDIVFDEGQDTAPDFFGLAVLDNVDVNGTLVGQGAGPQNGQNNDDNDDNDDNDHGDNHGDNHGGDRHK